MYIRVCSVLLAQDSDHYVHCLGLEAILCATFLCLCSGFWWIGVAIINMLQTVVDWSLPQEILLSLLMEQAPPGSWFGKKTEETTLTGCAITLSWTLCLLMLLCKCMCLMLCELTPKWRCVCQPGTCNNEYHVAMPPAVMLIVYKSYWYTVYISHNDVCAVPCIWC